MYMNDEKKSDAPLPKTLKSESRIKSHKINHVVFHRNFASLYSCL